MSTYYEILQVNPTASMAEIETAYEAQYNHWRRLVTHHDPQIVNQANQALQWLERVRTTLTDPNQREAYDASIGLHGPVGGLADPQARQAPVARPTPPPPRASQPAQPTLDAVQRVDAWACPRCQTANAIGTRFCKKCGTQIGTECAKCASLLEIGAQFCPACGANQDKARREKEMEDAARIRQEREQAQRQAQERARREAEEQRMKNLNTGLAILGVCAGALAAPMAWASIWPDVVHGSTCLGIQAVMGAIGGCIASVWLGGSVGKSADDGAGYVAGLIAGVIGGILAFPIIALGIVLSFLGG